MAGTEPQRDGRDFALVPAAGLVVLAASRPARPGPYLPPPPWLRKGRPQPGARRSPIGRCRRCGAQIKPNRSG